MTALTVTVAICTWNRAALLRRTLESFLSLVPPRDADWRVLVVNNSCTDNTEDVVREFAGRLPIVSVLEPVPGVSNARNCALREANSQYLLFTDDDVLVSPGWLGAFVSAARRYPAAVAFGGPIDPWFVVTPDPDLAAAFPNLRVGFCAVDHRLPEGPISDRAEIATENLLYGANMAFSLPGLAGLMFNPAMGPVHDRPMFGEETLFVGKLRARGDAIVWVPDMRLKHYVDPARMTLKYLLPYYEGVGRAHVKLYGRGEGPMLFGVPRWIYRKRTECAAKWLWNAVRGRRVESLTSRREYRFYTGMAKECRIASPARAYETRLPQAAPAVDEHHATR
jgi:glycosyltransferase involved in cell wall biosynthesis